jgi:hypothetical protein
VNQRNLQCQNTAELTSTNVEEWRSRILVRGINRRVCGLQFESYLKLIKKLNGWLLQMIGYYKWKQGDNMNIQLREESNPSKI